MAGHSLFQPLVAVYASEISVYSFPRGRLVVRLVGNADFLPGIEQGFSGNQSPRFRVKLFPVVNHSFAYFKVMAAK